MKGRPGGYGGILAALAFQELVEGQRDALMKGKGQEHASSAQELLKRYIERRYDPAIIILSGS